MQRKFFGILGMLLVGTASAQTLPPASDLKATLAFADPAKAATNPPVDELQAPCPGAAYQGWASGEYLLWWTKNAPAPVLVTTGDSTDAFPGALGQPGTRVLFGGSGLDYGAISGFRVTLGAWIDSDRTLGLEGSGFLLEQRSVSFNAGSDPAGNPALYLPLFRADLGREGVYRVADPVVGFNGGVGVNAQTRLWGAEVNGLFNIMRCNGRSIDLLAGFRYADLAENLTIDTSSTDFVNQITDVTNDRFATRNQFYGGQLGIRAGFQQGRASVDIAGKVALGANHQTVDIGGGTVETGAGSANPGTFPGGVFSQPSNIGSSTRNQFAVIPEVQIKLAYQVRPYLKAFVGYDFLYWNQVVRPGSQIDRNINPTQSLGGVLAGPASPQPLFNRTDYWAQGVNFGLEFRY